MRMATKRGRQLNFVGEFDLIYSANIDGLYKSFTQQTFVTGPCLGAGGFDSEANRHWLLAAWGVFQLKHLDNVWVDFIANEKARSMAKNRAGEERASMVRGWRHYLSIGKKELQHQISQGKSWMDTGACSFWSEMGWGLSRTWSRNCDELRHLDKGQELL